MKKKVHDLKAAITVAMALLTEGGHKALTRDKLSEALRKRAVDMGHEPVALDNETMGTVSDEARRRYDDERKPKPPYNSATPDGSDAPALVAMLERHAGEILMLDRRERCEAQARSDREHRVRVGALVDEATGRFDALAAHLAAVKSERDADRADLDRHIVLNDEISIVVQTLRSELEVVNGACGQLQLRNAALEEDVRGATAATRAAEASERTAALALAELRGEHGVLRVRQASTDEELTRLRSIVAIHDHCASNSVRPGVGSAAQ